MQDRDWRLPNSPALVYAYRWKTSRGRTLRVRVVDDWGRFRRRRQPQFRETGKPTITRVTHRVMADSQSLVVVALLALPAGEERDRSWAYLASRRSQIAYRDFRARGWSIGSGCVESGHRGWSRAA